MDNVIRIRIGDLGSCSGGSVSEVRHDSTCTCEGCHERRLAGKEFEIVTGPLSSKDASDVTGKGDVIVLGDDDVGADRDSDIFGIEDDMVNGDGYCGDGQGDVDEYSLRSPKPCTVNGDDDIEVQDMPPVAVEDTIGCVSIKSAKRDSHLVEECLEEVEGMAEQGMDDKGTDEFLWGERQVVKYWKEQVIRYKSIVSHMSFKISRYADGLKAAETTRL